jgi:hypothetical protein
VKKAIVAGFAIAVIAIATTNSCTVGSGTGSLSGDLDVPDCWTGNYDLKPDFFGATPNPNDDTLFIRIQRGSDYINFSDGVSILVTHVSEVTAAIFNNGGAPQPQTLTVSLPPSVVPPGVPITPTANPATAQFALYMQGSCRPETPGLYAMDNATTNGATAGPDGGGASLCNADTLTIANQCGVTPVPTVPTGTSTITFQHLFDASLAEGGDPGSLSADQRNIQATFDVLVADPRDECSGGLGPPPPCRGHLTGSFQFYFERGKPAQAFP